MGRIAAEACSFEPFHEAVSIDDVFDCVRKQLTLRHAASLRVQPSGDARGVEPRPLWIISAGRPTRAIEELGFQPLAGWPAGYYGMTVGWRVYLVVVRELPRARDTVLLRLLGAKRVLLDAIEDLTALPRASWERRVAGPALARLRLTIPADPALRSPEDEELLMTTTDVYETWKKNLIDQVLAEGRELGLEQGRELGLEQGRELGLEQGRELGLEQGQRALRQAASALFEARFGPMPSELRGALQRLSDPDGLARLVTVTGTQPREEVERTLLALAPAAPQTPEP